MSATLPNRMIGVAAPATPSMRRAIPFDYAFRYDLRGEPNNVINRIVTVSIEAEFTAVSIGYGVIPKVQPITFGVQVPPPPPPAGAAPVAARRGFTLGDVTISSLLSALAPVLANTTRGLRNETGPEAALKNGIKLNPEIAEFVLRNNGAAPLTPDVLERLFQVVGSPPEQIQFKYAIFDEGTGREFQSEPILNIAGLGSAKGERPFRYFAQPIMFAPRSTIRMEITEVSDFTGQLHVSLHGYKVLGGTGSPTAETRPPRSNRRGRR